MEVKKKKQQINHRVGAAITNRNSDMTVTVTVTVRQVGALLHRRRHCEMITTCREC